MTAFTVSTPYCLQSSRTRAFATLFAAIIAVRSSRTISATRDIRR